MYIFCKLFVRSLINYLLPFLLNTDTTGKVGEFLALLLVMSVEVPLVNSSLT